MMNKQLVVGTVFAIFHITVSWKHHKLTSSSAYLPYPLSLSMKPPRDFLPSVVTLMLVPPKISHAFCSACGFTTSHDFDAFGLYPNFGWNDTIISHQGHLQRGLCQ